jgi:long-chain acyl-CoA synthetase
MLAERAVLPQPIPTVGDESIPARFLRQAARRPTTPGYWARRAGRFEATSWADYATEVRRAARALVALGVEPGGTTAILGFNRPEWVVFAMATMAAGGAPAGIYTTSSPPEIGYVVGHAESPVVLVEDEAQWQKIAAVRGDLPRLRHVVLMRGAAVDDPAVLTWEAFLARGDAVPEAALEERLAGIRPDGVATLIYTSGTTGPPKAVMLSHRSLAWTADVARELVQLGDDATLLSYLPLSHIAEQMFTIHGPATAGCAVAFAESLERLADNLREVRPTVFFGVPRVWEKLQLGVTAKLAEARGAKAALAGWARGVGARYHERRLAGEDPGPALTVQYRLADRLVLSRVRRALGLDRAQVCVSGAAPIARDVLEFMASLGIVVREVYGQSEDCGPTAINLPGRTRFGTVGPPIPGVTVRIAEDGEILVRGPNVFLGYYKDPGATADALQDGWLHSGDLGRFEPDGLLRITGRKKDLIITSGGKNVAPANLEKLLEGIPLVSHAVVVGDGRHYLSALLTLDEAALERLAAERGLPAEGRHHHPDVRAVLQEGVDAVNAKVARVESIRRLHVLETPLSVADGTLTPTLKVRRQLVTRRYAREIEALYAP